MTHHAPPPALTGELRRLTGLELSRAARASYVCLLLAACTMTAVVTALLVTEPALPRRTSVALAVMIAIGLSWVVFAGWVLSRKRILLGRDRVVAGRLAVAFTSVFVIGSLFVGGLTGAPSAFAASALGVVMAGVAAWLLFRARQQFARLTTRRLELERQLGKA